MAFQNVLKMVIVFAWGSLPTWTPQRGFDPAPHREPRRPLDPDLISDRVRSGQGKLEKSGENRKPFPVTRKSGNIDYSPIGRERQGSIETFWVENLNSAHNRLFFEAAKKKKQQK